MADHSLKPATDHRLCEPLPHQLANQTQAHPEAITLSDTLRYPYAGLPIVSKGYTTLQGRFLRVTHPFATQQMYYYTYSVRLACVKHTASVHPEPGSNSQKKQKPQSKLTSLPDISL